MKNQRVVLTLLIALWMTGCAGRPAGSQAAKSEATPVKVRRVQKVSQPARITASGSVEPDQTVKVAFQVAGKVARVLVEEGAAVGAGQLLAELDATDYRLGAEAAAGQTGMARAALDKAQTGARAQEIERARAAYEQAADEYGRLKKLYERKSLAPSDFKKIEAHYLAAKAQYEEAQEGARREDKAAAKAALEQAQAGERVRAKAGRHATAGAAGGTGGAPHDRGGRDHRRRHAGLRSHRPRAGQGASGRAGIRYPLVRVGQTAAVVAPALPGQSFEGGWSRLAWRPNPPRAPTA
jgi:multidrug efflux pump subunit AcrA (membrane-fusion protein)